MYINYLFIITGTVLALLFIFRSTFVKMLKDNMKISAFISFITAMTLLYVVFAFSLAIILPGIQNKVVMLLLSASPFIIGKIATYEKVHFYSIIQVICIIAGIGYALFI